jgi:hypothetical protein
VKKVKHITCWTDYPFVELGDEPNKPALIRHVNIVSYDGDKYCQVLLKGHDLLDVKIGYLYSQFGRYGTVKQVNIRKIMRMGDGKCWREHVQWRRRFEREDRRFQEQLRQTRK